MKRSLTLVAGLLTCWTASAAAAETLPPNSAAVSQPEMAQLESSKSEASQPALSQPAASQPEGSVSIAALLGYGFAGDLGSGDDNVFGVSYGLSAGYVFPSNLHLGGTVLRYLGPTDDEAEYLTFTLDLELGYQIGEGPFTVRPSFGLGVLMVIIDGDGDDGNNSALRPQVVPALLAQYSLGIVRLGAEARYAIVTSYPHVVALLGSAGVAF